MDKDTIPTVDLIHMTGFHSMCGGYDLQSAFFMDDCLPLDAPYFIAAGSTVVGPFSQTVQSSTVMMVR